MTTAPKHLAPIPAPVASVPWTRRDWWALGAVAVAAFLTRFIALGKAVSSGTPVFDEKHYVPQAWDMVRSFHDPILGGIESNPAYGLVVHPPLAKQIIALSEFVFGYSAWGWRAMTALFGVGTVLLIQLLARRLARSTWVGLMAGVLALFDGVLITASRFGMLDIFLTFFVVAAAYMLARDRDEIALRVHRATHRGAMWRTPTGPSFGFRWWRFGCGVMLGLALSVKWSGLYYIAFFGVLSVFLDWQLRKKYLVEKPFLSMLRKDAFPAFASLVLVPFALYVWSWRAWFADETSVYRHAREAGVYGDDAWYSFLPDAAANWIYYHQSVLEFHASLTTSNGHQHPWESKPWAWLVAWRPILYYSDRGDDRDTLIYMFGTPAIWWLTVPVVGWALWMLVRKQFTRLAIPLTAFTAGFLPWLIGYDRQMYFFYATTMVPFTIILLAIAAATIFDSGRVGRIVTIGYFAAVFANFIFFLPIIYGISMPHNWLDQLFWLPSWR